MLSHFSVSVNSNQLLVLHNARSHNTKHHLLYGIIETVIDESKRIAVKVKDIARHIIMIGRAQSSNFLKKAGKSSIKIQTYSECLVRPVKTSFS